MMLPEARGRGGVILGKSLFHNVGALSLYHRHSLSFLSSGVDSRRRDIKNEKEREREILNCFG